MKLIILTGANKGLGEAIFDIIKNSKNVNLLIITRKNVKDQHELSKKSNIQFINKDLSEIENVDFITTKIDFANTKELVFINNAATISPIGKIGSFINSDIYKTIKINTLFPLLLINSICKNGNGMKLNIINISSGAAKHAIDGWSLYCATKSCNEMFFKVLKKETKNDNNIQIHNIDPGVMNTDMQKEIRAKSQAEFPDVESFISLEKENKLRKVEEVAFQIINEFEVL